MLLLMLSLMIFLPISFLLMFLFLLVAVYLSPDGADSWILSFSLFISILWHLLSDIFDFINILNRLFFPVALLAESKLHGKVCQIDLLNFLPDSHCNESL